MAVPKLRVLSLTKAREHLPGLTEVRIFKSRRPFPLPERLLEFHGVVLPADSNR